MSPKGAAFLYARPDVQEMLEPLIVSWGYQAAPETSTGSQFLDYYQWTGTKDPAAALSVPAALEFMQLHHWNDVRQDCHRMLRSAIERICSLVNMPHPYTRHSNLYHQMGVAPLPSNTNLDALKTALYTEYKVEVPLIEWKGQKFVRISVQGYNTPDDLDQLIEGLAALLPDPA
jgi:isopenicillin-N epimerase